MKCRSSPIGRFRHCMKIGDEGRKWSGKTKGTFQSRCCERRTLDKYRRCGSPPPPYDVPPAIYRINTSHLRTQAHSAFERHGREGRMRVRSEEHTSELQSLMRISYAVFCLKKKTQSPQSQK